MISNGRPALSEPPDIIEDDDFDDDGDDVYYTLWVIFKDDPSWMHPFGPVDELVKDDLFSVLAGREDVQSVQAVIGGDE